MDNQSMFPGTEKSIVLPETLQEAHEKIKQLYHFIEMTEALTYDSATSNRIGSFLKQEGVWN